MLSFDVAYRSPTYGGGPTHQQKQPSQQPPHLSIKQEPTKHHYSLQQQQQHRKPGPPSPLHSSRTFYSKTYPYSNLNEHSTATSSGSKVLPSHSNQSHSNPTSGASFVTLELTLIQLLNQLLQDPRLGHLPLIKFSIKIQDKILVVVALLLLLV